MIDLTETKKQYAKRMKKICKAKGCDWSPTAGQDHRITFRVCTRCGNIGWLM